MGAAAYTVLAVHSSESSTFFEISELWQESPPIYFTALAAVSGILLLFHYALLRIFLPFTRPQVTRRWRKMPLALRTMSLVQSVVMFQGLLAMPWIYLGVGLGLLLCLLAGKCGVMAALPASALLFVASLTLLAAAVCRLAIRDFEHSHHSGSLGNRPSC
jgi:hypothetical protein